VYNENIPTYFALTHFPDFRQIPEIAASYLDILLNIDSNGRLTTTLYDKCDDFDFAIVNIPFLCACSNVPFSSAYDVYIYQLIQYTRACFAYETFQSEANS
jgi:hypothetical protein